MNKDVYGILGDLTAEILLEIIAECMDDYLYVIDLQNNKMEISQSALDRFMISETHVRNVKQEIMSVVYKEDRTMFAKHMQAVMDGKEKVHDIHYRWLDKNGLPVWVNCRGVVIDDEDGKPGYLVGCLNETGNQRRADNVTGLLGGMDSPLPRSTQETLEFPKAVPLAQESQPKNLLIIMQNKSPHSLSAPQSRGLPLRFSPRQKVQSIIYSTASEPGNMMTVRYRLPSHTQKEW